MKKMITLLFVMTTGLLLVCRAMAQTFTTLYSFSGIPGTASTNSDGAYPTSLILSGNTLYGTASDGGTNGSGTIFAIKTDGTGFTNLHTFSALGWDSSVDDGADTNADGATPFGGLILSGNTLFGTAIYGGSSGNGTVFAISTNGAGFTNLYNFSASYVAFYTNWPGDGSTVILTNSDGANPNAGVILAGSTLYGTTAWAGSSGSGTVFALNTNGTVFSVLHSFTAIPVSPPFTNGDGGISVAGLVLSGNTLYGTAAVGGSVAAPFSPVDGGSGCGTVFALNTNGTCFTNLHNFGNGSDGIRPEASLILFGNTLYGITSLGGTNGCGMVFAINTDGTNYTDLHDFTNATSDAGLSSEPGLVLSGNTLYGATIFGGAGGWGTIFALTTNGVEFTNLYSFSEINLDNSTDWDTNSDGANPTCLILSGSTLYGTAGDGGTNGSGTLFSIFLPVNVNPVNAPYLTLIPDEGNMVLTWPTNFTGFTLQSTTNLALPVWDSVSQAQIVIGGQNVVITPTSGTRQFYRLSQ